MFKLKNHETGTFTTFLPSKDGKTVDICQVEGGENLAFDGEVSVDEARDFWQLCVNHGAERVK